MASSKNRWQYFFLGHLDVQTPRRKKKHAWKTSCCQFPSTLPLKPAIQLPKTNGTLLLMEKILHQLRLVVFPLFTWFYTSQVDSRICFPGHSQTSARHREAKPVEVSGAKFNTKNMLV